MIEAERELIRVVCDGDIRKAQKQARVLLEQSRTQKDESFCKQMLRILDSKGPTLIELPYNLRSMLVAEDTETFPDARFLLREEEAKVVDDILSLYRAAGKLAELGIPYLPALILHGCSGCGKTMLARYIAHVAGIPFVYVQFSSLVDSKFGGTQGNIAKIFEYARTAPCVLCFDEIDAIGMARGQKDDIGEMNRIVISVMQEMDRIPNNVLIVGTTNRFDRLDSALVRRFPLQHEVKPLQPDDARALAKKFLTYAGVVSETDTNRWFEKKFQNHETYPASIVVDTCTKLVVKILVSQAKSEENDT